MLDDLATKKGINEIVINGPRNVFVERGGEFIGLSVDLSLDDIYEFIRDVADYNKKVCDHDMPILDGNLEDGSRINIILSPFANKSPAITIRKYVKTTLSLEKNSKNFGIDPKWVPFFRALILAKKNVIISGGTGVGKTTFMNMILREVPQDERVVTIEDTLELNIQNNNCVRLEAGSKIDGEQTSITVRDLVKNTLRMRPDRIIIGEVRGGEVFDLLQAMNTGHEGSMASVHANSSTEALSRLETLFMMAGFDIPYHVVRRQIASAVDFIIQLGRSKDGKRSVLQVLELNGMEGNTILTSSIFESENGNLLTTGVAPSCLNDLVEDGDLDRAYFS
jgi:pilus assembly protein CpaF